MSVIHHYFQFIGQRLNESIDQDKIYGLKDRIRTLSKRLNNEKDSNKRRKLQLQIKVCELKIQIEQLP